MYKQVGDTTVHAACMHACFAAHCQQLTLGWLTVLLTTASMMAMCGALFAAFCAISAEGVRSS